MIALTRLWCAGVFGGVEPPDRAGSEASASLTLALALSVGGFVPAVLVGLASFIAHMGQRSLWIRILDFSLDLTSSKWTLLEYL